jgi:WD40 repeat protein
MNDMSDFELELGDRLQRYALPAGREFDPTAIAHTVVGRPPPAGATLLDLLRFVRRWTVDRRALSLALLILALLVAAAAALLGSGSAPPRLDRILYTDGARLHVLEPGTGLDATLAVAGPDADARMHQVSWAPDRRRIAFVAETGTSTVTTGTETLWVANPDGQLARALGTCTDIPFAWSPDSLRVAFENLDFGLSVGSVDGTGSQRLDATFWKDSGGPTWSPDGSRIALTSSSPNHPIVVVDVAVGATSLLAGWSEQYAPRWSPDGSEIAYSTGGHYSLDVIHPDGTEHRRVVADRFAYGFEWSPNGRALAVSNWDASRTHVNRISIVDPATGALRDVLNLDAPPTRFAWSPDGTQLAYLTQTRELWVVRDDGTDPRRVATAVADFDW